MPLLQEIAAVSLVCIAATYVGYRSWKTLVKKGAAGCGGGCTKCPAGEQEASTPSDFVGIEQLTGPGGTTKR